MQSTPARRARRGKTTEVGGRKSEVSSAQLSSSFASYAFGVIKSIRFAVICCKRYKIAARKPLPQEMEDGSESRCQMAKGSVVIRYLLLGRSVVMNCVDDLKDFYVH